ncbi:MAG TPA: hypothetical protein EYG94_06150 [Campylobacterales bacterium]|nr:hypothetical protein [Campylobacterales bacterium]
MQSTTFTAKSIKKLIKQIDKHLADGFKPAVSLIYLSPVFNLDILVDKISKYDFLIMGGTTAGEVYANSKDGVHELDKSIVCMLIEVGVSALDMTVVQVSDDKDSYVVGEHIGLWAKSSFADCAIITLTAGLAFDNDSYTQGIVSKGIDYVFGGATGDDMMLKETQVFSNALASNHGVVALALDKSKIDVLGSRAFGWDGIGKERIVTKSKKNVVYEIDGIAATSFYKRYLDVGAKDMLQVGLAYPLEVLRRNGEVVYRAILDINEEEGSLIFAGHVEEMSRVRISIPKGKSIIAEVENSTKKTLDENPHFTPELALVFPCCSRKQVLGHLAYLEVEAIIKNADIPLAGFFAYGEIGAFPGGYGFHNETFVTAFLQEKVSS